MKEVIATKDNENKYLLLELDGKTNSFTSSFLTTLEHWLDVANDDRQINSIIITSRSKVFSVGGDLNQMMEEINSGNKSGYVDKIVPRINRVIEKIITHNLPIICVLNGVAAGGGLSLALSCDYVFAKQGTKLVPAFGSLALSPDSGSSIILPLKLGYSKALQLTATSESLSVEEARDLGAIDAVGNPDDMMNQALELSSKFAKADRWALSRTKRLMNQGVQTHLKERLDAEYQSIHEASSRDEFTLRLKNMITGMK